MRSTLMPASRAAAGLPPTAWISWPIAVRSTSSQSPPSTSAMMTIVVGNAEQPAAERELQEGLRHAGDDRHAGRIGEGEPDEDGADAERGDDRIDLELGDDEAVDDADQRAERQHDEDGDRDRQLVLHDQAGDQHAMQAGGKPMERSSSPTITASVSPPAMIIASDAWLSTLVKLLTRREGARRQEREDDDHQPPARRSCRSARRRRAPPWHAGDRRRVA